MLLVDEFYEIVLDLVGWLFVLLTVFFATFYHVEIVLVALKEEFVTEVYAVFVAAYLVKSIHIQLQIN